MQIIDRIAWHAAPPTGNMATQEPRDIAEVFVHHSDSPGARVLNVAEAAAIVRAMQRFHQQTRGWSDIAYHFVVVPQHGDLADDFVFAGRPLAFVPAAQLNHNTNTAAICIVQKDPERLKLATVRSVAALARRVPHAERLRGHYEVFATECPGPIIRAHLDDIADRAGKRR